MSDTSATDRTKCITVAELATAHRTLDRDLTHAIRQLIEKFETETGVGIRGMSVEISMREFIEKRERHPGEFILFTRTETERI